MHVRHLVGLTRLPRAQQLHQGFAVGLGRQLAQRRLRVRSRIALGAKRFVAETRTAFRARTAIVEPAPIGPLAVPAIAKAPITSIRKAATVIGRIRA